MPIDNGFFIHPQDQAALTALQAIPLFDTVLKTYWKLINERTLHGINMASKIRLGPGQLDDIYRFLPEVCSVLELPEPEFYLEMDPRPNAYTFGDTKPFVVVNSGLVELLRPDELKAVIAHECGHILCRHCLYHSLGLLLLETGQAAAGLGGLSSAVVAPVFWALTYWMRRSELSCDRVAAYVMGDAGCVMRTMMRLAGGSPRITEKIDMTRYLAQSEEYLSSVDESSFDKILQAWIIKDQTHPFPGVRCMEVRDWFEQNRGHLPDRLRLPSVPRLPGSKR